MSDEGSKNYVSVGPWGGQDGARWDDGVYSTVRQLIVNHGAGIDSIQIEYDKKGCSVWSDKHGGTGGYKTDKIKLDFPNEFLISISGYYGRMDQWNSVSVRSLTFKSNRKIYGPFGIEEGNHFSFPVTGGKIIGFHGQSGWCLDSIGVYMKPLKQQIPSENFLVHSYGEMVVSVKANATNNKKVSFPDQVEINGTPNTRRVVSYGPWGGNGGTIFDDGVNTGVREIHLTRNGGVTSIKVCYDRNGQAVWGNKNGGSGGIRLDKIVLDYPSEILTHFTGYYGSTIFRGPTVVKSLTFHTNKRTYGPFGDEQGMSFSSGSKEGMIVGFHGRKGWFVDSIGVHVLEGKLLPLSPNEAFNMMGGMRIAEVMYGMVKEPAPIGPGPWGGDGGRPWDDGVFSGVKQIYLIRGEAICSIQIEYDRNGQSVWSTRHGGGGGDSTYKIKFEYPVEVLTGISGYYGSILGDETTKAIGSLTFYTNRGRYGPYGKEVGTFFSSMTEGKVVGFHGRSGCYLDAIGVHMEHGPGSGDRGFVKAVLNKLFG